MLLQKYRIFITVMVLILFGLNSQSLSQTINDLTIITEQYPPYNFQTDEKLLGISVDTMVLMLEKVNSTLKRNDIKIRPWVRGYNKTLTHPNTCLFSTTRTKERENLFKWVGPVGLTKIVVIAKKSSNIKITSAKELNQFKIGVISKDIAEQTLLGLGIEKSNLQAVGKTILNIRKLNLGRIDLWGYGENVAKWELRSNGFNPDDYETVYLMMTKELYFAFNKETPEYIIMPLQKALDQVKESGEYQKILDRYLK